MSVHEHRLASGLRVQPLSTQAPREPGAIHLFQCNLVTWPWPTWGLVLCLSGTRLLLLPTHGCSVATPNSVSWGIFWVGSAASLKSSD